MILMVKTIYGGFFIGSSGGTINQDGGLWTTIKTFFTGSGLCAEDWRLTASSCLTNNTRLRVYVDSNNCGTFNNLPTDNGTFYDLCNYCTMDLVYNYTSGCVYNDETRNYYANATVFDANWASCCAITGLDSDCFEDDNQLFNYTYTGEYGCEGEDGMMLGIILLPILFGIFLIIGAVSLGEDHAVLRIFMYLLSIVTIFVSMHYGSIALAYYVPALNELQDALGTTIYWFGRILFVMIIYFLMYTFIKIVQKIATSKKEKLNY